MSSNEHDISEEKDHYKVPMMIPSERKSRESKNSMLQAINVSREKMLTRKNSLTKEDQLKLSQGKNYKDLYIEELARSKILLCSLQEKDN